MILTVTMNPSVDISYPLEFFTLDTVNRAVEVHKTAGGKGLNVARVLADFGEEVGVTGLIGGSNGSFLLSQLEETIKADFFAIEGNTRNCIAILHEGNQTEILEMGPTVTATEATTFLSIFRLLLLDASVVTMSGSLAKGLLESYYIDLISLANDSHKDVVLDCSGKALEAVLKSHYKPRVIKPNIEELSQLLQKTVPEDIETLKEILSDSLFAGIEWIIVSLGKNGAFAKHKETFYTVDIPTIEVVNPVGSGDATVAGIASALAHGLSDEDLLKRANAFGMLNAQEPQTGHINPDNYKQLFDKIKVKEV